MNLMAVEGEGKNRDIVSVFKTKNENRAYNAEGEGKEKRTKATSSSLFEFVLAGFCFALAGTVSTVEEKGG